MNRCLTHNCNEYAIPGSDYCLNCLSRQNGHGSDGAAMIIPAISTIEPYAIQIEGDEGVMQAIAELQDRQKRCKAELDRQREANQELRGDLLRAEYSIEQQDDTIRQMAITIQRQAVLIRRQQAQLDGRMTSIREIKKRQGFVIQMAQHEQNCAEHLERQLEQLRSNLMQVPFVGTNGQGEWVQTAQDDVAPLENGFRAEYAKLDPETFEVNGLFWFRAE